MFCRLNVVGEALTEPNSASEPPPDPLISTTPVEKPGTICGPVPPGRPMLFRVVLRLVRLKENRAVLSTVGEKV